jgi:hypothetical protein
MTGRATAKPALYHVQQSRRSCSVILPISYSSTPAAARPSQARAWAQCITVGSQHVKPTTPSCATFPRWRVNAICRALPSLLARRVRAVYRPAVRLITGRRPSPDLTVRRLSPGGRRKSLGIREAQITIHKVWRYWPNKKTVKFGAAQLRCRDRDSMIILYNGVCWWGIT